MVERQHLKEVPKSVPFNLPEKPPEGVLHDAGFHFADYGMYEEAGVEIDFASFVRAEVPEEDGRLIYVPKLNERQTAVLRAIKPALDAAVADVAITDEGILKAGRSGLKTIYAKNIQNPLSERLAYRTYALGYTDRLENSPATTFSAALLLMDHEVFRMIGANTALSVPNGIGVAFAKLDQVRRELPGGRTFVQMFFEGKIRDRESLYRAARERNRLFFDRIISVIESIDDATLLQFDDLAQSASASFKKRAVEVELLKPLQDFAKHLEEAVSIYAKHIEGKDSHFGSVVVNADGSMKAIGLNELNAAYGAITELLDEDHFGRYLIGRNKVPHLPGIAPKVAFDMGSLGERPLNAITLEELKVTNDFQTSIVKSILILSRQIDGYFAKKILSANDDSTKRKIESVKRGIVRGMIVEMLMINEFFMASLQTNNKAIRGMITELLSDPEGIVSDANRIANIKALAHLGLGNLAQLYHARKIGLSILGGALS